MVICQDKTSSATIKHCIKIEYVQQLLAPHKHIHVIFHSLHHTSLHELLKKLEVHRLSADNRYRLIIGQFPIIGIGRLLVLVSKTTKNAFNCSSH